MHTVKRRFLVSPISSLGLSFLKSIHCWHLCSILKIAKYCTCINSFEPPNLWGVGTMDIFIPIYRWRNWNSRNLSYIFPYSHTASDTDGIQTLVFPDSKLYALLRELLREAHLFLFFFFGREFLSRHTQLCKSLSTQGYYEFRACFFCSYPESFKMICDECLWSWG